MLKSARKYQKIPKNVRKYQKMSKKCQKMPDELYNISN